MNDPVATLEMLRDGNISAAQHYGVDELEAAAVDMAEIAKTARQLCERLAAEAVQARIDELGERLGEIGEDCS